MCVREPPAGGFSQVISAVMEQNKGTSRECAGLLKRAARRPSSFEAGREELLGDWLGSRAPGVFADMRPQLAQVSQLLDECLNRLNCAEAVDFDKIRGAWREIVNSDLAARMLRPVSIRDGVLTVECANPSFQMAYRDPRILDMLLKRVNDFAGGKVTSIRFAAQGRSGAGKCR